MSWFKEKQIIDTPEKVATKSNKYEIPPDNPILCQEADTLDRANYAKTISQYILQLETKDGLVVGILGPWGSGKTSFINLMKEEWLKDLIPVLEFNPWMFSGAEQLVERFFIELSSQLQLRSGFTDIALKMTTYGESLSNLKFIPFIGEAIGIFGGISKVIKSILEIRKKGVMEPRKELAKALKGSRTPIIVVIDDIDRLSTQEIKDIFKLVRLTGCFPNIVYILAFDRSRVEVALAETGLNGRDYLEKILQIAIDIPEVPNQNLENQLFNEIRISLQGVEDLEFDQDRWPDIYVEIIRPLVRNLRDVRRYALSIRSTILYLKGKIAIVDLLALEAIRIFLPDVFRLLYKLLPTLTDITSESFLMDGNIDNKNKLETLIKLSNEYGNVIRSLIKRIFPIADQYLDGPKYSGNSSKWLHERRVANGDMLQLYFEGVAGSDLTSYLYAEKAFEKFNNLTDLENYFLSLDPTKLEATLRSLEHFRDKFKKEHGVPGITVILKMLCKIPDRPARFMEYRIEQVIGVLIYQLLKVLENDREVEENINSILPNIASLSLQILLIKKIGHFDNTGHKLISEEVANTFEKNWLEKLLQTDVSSLMQERDLLGVFIMAMKISTKLEFQYAVPENPEITLKVLKEAIWSSMSMGIESRAINVESPRLHWKALLIIYINQDSLKNRIKELKESNLSIDKDLITLAEDYLMGKYPDDFD